MLDSLGRFLSKGFVSIDLLSRVTGVYWRWYSVGRLEHNTTVLFTYAMVPLPLAILFLLQ